MTIFKLFREINYQISSTESDRSSKEKEQALKKLTMIYIKTKFDNKHIYVRQL